jgi:dephospho-CoA kinase
MSSAIMPPSWHIGITGGIGSGKSTVAALLQAAGAFVIDADELARACTRAHGSAIGPIRQAFGDDFIDADGAMRRDAMRELVFRLPEARRKLEDIIHPIVFQQAQELGKTAERQGRTVVLYEIPLLAESPHWRKRLHRVIVVDCDEDTQIRRATQRSSLTWETARSIVASQASRPDRWRIADAVIFNGGSVDPQQLREQVCILGRSFGLMIEKRGIAK